MKCLLMGLMIGISNLLAGQDMSIDETLDYINTILDASTDDQYMYRMDVSGTGALTITRKHYKYKDKSSFKKIDELHVRLNDLSEIYITKRGVENCYGLRYGYGRKHIKLWCKDRSDCVFDPSKNPNYTCCLELYIDLMYYDCERLLNAIIYLVRKGKETYGSTPEDVNDPFAPSKMGTIAKSKYR